MFIHMASDEKDPLASPRGDFYHQGVVTKLFPSNNTGVVRTESGRELTFSYDLVILSGEAKSPLAVERLNKMVFAGNAIPSEICPAGWVALLS